VRVRLTDIRDHSVQEIDLLPDSRDMPGWQDGASGWSLGPKGSGSPIELDEQLGECRVGVFTFTYQVLLWGVAKELPEVWLFPQSKPTNQLVPFDPEVWLRLDREELKRVSMGGDIRLRFDQSPVRFGHYILESLKGSEPARDCCAFCNEILQTYFRVGSQQACPRCTQEFEQKMADSLSRNYRRALGIGIVTAIAGGAIDGLLLAAVGVSFGSILIGALVGFAMRVASRESAGSRYRTTAAVLTLIAGSLPWWVSFQGSAGMFMSAVYLAIGVFVAWRIAGRNVRTEIQGPFQSKTA
jgi:hypothetical protein